VAISRLPLAAALLLAMSGALAAKPATAPVPKADKEHIRAHIAFLADDLLEGRETGSRGYDIAASYVASQLRQYGVAPRGDAGGYLQKVPMRMARLVPGSAVFELHGKTGKEALVQFDQFSATASTLEEQSEVTAPLVFIGHGIQAPRFGIDDYAGVDVKGKIVVTLARGPSNLPTEEGAHFMSGRQKRELANKYGAVGMVSLHTPAAEKVSPFAKIRDYQHIPVMSWVDPAGKAAHEDGVMQNRTGLSMAASQKLFANVDVKLDELYALAAANKPLPKMDLNMSARLAKKSTLSNLASHNVIGMIEGSDPVLKNEYVVYSAHLDHLGTVKEKSGDNIYNGAMDNASGVATLLEAARMFAQSPVRPKRSILFIALTGEEKGMLGSEYFAANPTVPKGSIVANVNLDMPLVTYDFSDVVAFGAEHSTLKTIAEGAVRKLGLNLVPDPWPEQGSFTRSDQYAFVQQGIPAISIKTGIGSFRKDEDPAKLWAAFRASYYHQPNDDLKLPFNFDAAARFAQLNYMVALEIANAPKRPIWNKGDFFGDTFSK
jgi:hypothetical protein